MCRFVTYLGEEIRLSSLLTEPEYSILHQSFHSHERVEPLNGDGYGVAWYVDGADEPAVLKEVHPAWNSFNLRSVSPVARSRTILAHVRAATPGLPVTQLNCHPFKAGELSFMHNGTVGGFLQIKQRLVSELRPRTFGELEGSTDSEHLFALVKEAWADTAGSPPIQRLENALRTGIERIEALREAAGVEEGSLLNLALSDGQRFVVTRFVSHAEEPANSLYVHSGRRYVCEEGVCRMIDPDHGKGAVIVCSEPLSKDAGWEAVPENHLVRVHDDLRVELLPF